MRQPVQFGKYVLLDRISVGGMAEVFKAKTFGVEGFEKVIAIKRILPSMGEDEDFISMFIDEAKIAGQLAHANIGQIHELGQVDGTHFIAMEYIQGRDLLQLQKRYRKLKKKLPVSTSCFIVMKICEGLNYAHKKRDVLGANLDIVHRDCSPQNVVLSYEGEVKLIDFGIARAASRSSRTQAGVLKGKFAYMSPEQVRGLPLDRRSDIFSIGTILFECLTGERLFSAESDFSTLERVRNAEFDRNAMKAAGVPPAVEAIVFKALMRSTEDRYQWCSEMATDLHAFLQTVDTVYTSRSLGQDVRAVFAKEVQRDRELMDSYAKITMADGLDDEPDLEIFVEGTGEERPRSLSPQAPEVRANSLASGSQPRRKTSDDESDFDGGATEVFGEIGMAELLRDMGIERKGVNADGSTLAPTDSDQPKVEVLNQAESSAPAAPPQPPSVPGRKETVLGMTPPPAGTAADQQVNALAPRYSVPVPTPHATATPSVPTPQPNANQSSPLLRLPSYGFSAGLPFPGRRLSTRHKIGNNRKIFIGLGIALAAGLIFLVLNMFVFGGGADEIAEARATLVVMVGDKKVADVFLDGKKQPSIEAGEDLTISDLEPGRYELRVEREGADSCTDSISVTAERVKYYNCDFAAKADASLLFEGLLETDSVLVDGQQVPTSSLKDALPMHAGKTQTIAISRNGKLVDEFTVTLKSGEERRHQVAESPDTAGDPTTNPETQNEAGKDPVVPGDSDKADEPQKKDAESGNSSRGATAAPAAPAVPAVPARKRSAVDLAGDAPVSKPKANLLEPTLDDAPIAEPVVTDTHGYLTAVTTPWARIFVDGKDTGKQTPVTAGGRIKLKPGMHKVTFVSEGKKYNFSVTIRAGKTKRLIETLVVAP